MLPELQTYHNYSSLTASLRAMAAQYPNVMRLSSIGQSLMGREIWLATVGAGTAENRPGIYIEANMHGGEVTGTEVCLVLLRHLLESQSDPLVQWLLHSWQVFIVPRVSPDGAEYFFDQPGLVRSSVREHPNTNGRLLVEDIDRDGRITTMRWQHERGKWRPSPVDSRLMVRRRPGDEGPFYMLCTEGIPGEGWQENELALTPPFSLGVDFNRNYPTAWKDEARQPGAGPTPLSEPETRAVAGFLSSHPEVGLAISYHTSGGLWLRPPGVESWETSILPEDLDAYSRLAEVINEVSGQPLMSVFAFNGGSATHGDFKDWAYANCGALSLTAEIWDAGKLAGLTQGWGRAALGSPEWENNWLRLLERAAADGEAGFVPWRKVEHPTLGTVEVGGFNQKAWLINPPARELDQECIRQLKTATALFRQLPRLRVERVRQSGSMSSWVIKIRNLGGLPATVAVKGRKLGRITPPAITVTAGDQVFTAQLPDLRPGRACTVRVPAGFPAEGRVNVSISGGRVPPTVYTLSTASRNTNSK